MPGGQLGFAGLILAGVDGVDAVGQHAQSGGGLGEGQCAASKGVSGGCHFGHFQADQFGGRVFLQQDCLLHGWGLIRKPLDNSAERQNQSLACGNA